MLSRQPKARPCTASFRPAGHIQRAPHFIQDQYIRRNDEWCTKTLRPIENERDLRKRVLRSHWKRTRVQEEELKKRPMSLFAAATTHRVIDSSCQCVPLFCQCVSLNTYWTLQKGILSKKGPKEPKWVSLPWNNKQTPPPDSLPPDLFPPQAEASLLGVGLSAPFQTRRPIVSRAAEGDSLPQRRSRSEVTALVLDTPTPCCASPPQQEKQQPAAVSIRPIRLEPAVTDCIYHLI